LKHIRAVRKPGLYALLDFHPFLSDPVNVRLLKDIAIEARRSGLVLLLIGHSLELPPELRGYSARFEMRLPDLEERRTIVEQRVSAYVSEVGSDVKIDSQALDILVDILGGLPHSDVERLAHTAIYQDGAITAEDVPTTMQAKYRLLNSGGVLSYEYDVASPADVAGFRNVKVWLGQRRAAFSSAAPPGLDAPKGILLIGVQGCGKSLAAKAAAGLLNVPLLRLDFGGVYDKYHGETEKNLRESLQVAETMSPCVLWLDEIEKGLASGSDDSGTSRRVLASCLTWMAERRSRVLAIVAAPVASQRRSPPPTTAAKSGPSIAAVRLNCSSV
jgi:SpoVK/Ycf46/Vps4 family AAA+-type ATPase